MATYTPNYNLKKPALNDKIRIADFNGNADIIDGAMNDNATLIAQLKSDIGIVENTNTATHNISAGQYVIWKGSLYTASSAISSGATLSDANLTAVSGGGLNALNDNIQKFPFRRMKALQANGTTTFTLPSYVDSAIIFAATSTSNGVFYIYTNGYLCPVKTATGLTVSLSSDYKTITVTNSTSATTYAACFSCVNAAT